jgi:glycosyltransferase involved in cell wall biosynthesis
MNVLIIENSLDGHRGIYLSWITRSLLSDGNNVVICLPEGLHSHHTMINLKHESLCYETYDQERLKIYKRLLGFTGFFAADFEAYSLFKNIYKSLHKKYEIDFVFIPFFDAIMYSTAIFGSGFGKCNFSGISMRPDFHYEKVGVNVPYKRSRYLKKYFFERLFKISSLNKLITLDEPLYDYYKHRHNDIVFMPEPADVVDDRSDKYIDLANELGLDFNKKKVLIFGALTGRKGIVQLLEAVWSKLDKRNLQIVLAGKLHGDMAKYLSDKKYKKYIENQTILIIDRFVTEEEEVALFAHSDISWLGYVNHYRASGVLIQSAKFGLPVIATKLGVIGWQVSRYELGVCINVMDPAQIEDAFSVLCDNKSKYDFFVENTRSAFIENTYANARKILNNVVS